MELCIEQKNDIDMRDFRLLIAQIKVKEKDFFESQLYLEIVMPVTNGTKKIIHGKKFYDYYSL